MAKTLRKIWWFDSFQIEAAQAWLEDMAVGGWHLRKLGLIFAYFQEGEPREVRYRCEIIDRRRGDLAERIEIYQAAGWEYVGKVGILGVFRADCGQSPEIHTDPMEQAPTLSPLYRPYCYLLFTTLVMFGLLPLPYLIHGNPLMSFMLDSDIGSFVLSLTVLLLTLTWISFGLIDVAGKVNRLKKGLPMEQEKPYRRLLLSNLFIWVTIFLLALSSTPFIIRHAASRDNFLPLPQGTLPAVRISQLAPEAQIYPAKDRNWYRESGSVLVPCQWFSTEVARVQMEEEFHDITLLSFVYEGRTPWLARRLANALTRKVYYRPDQNNTELIKKDGPVDIWMSENGNYFEVIAVQGQYVYHVFYNGRIHWDYLLELVVEKLNSLERQQLPGQEQAWGNMDWGEQDEGGKADTLVLVV